MRSRERMTDRVAAREFIYTRVCVCVRECIARIHEMHTEIRRLITKNIASAMENRKIFLKSINVRKIVLISIFSFPGNTYISQKIFLYIQSTDYIVYVTIFTT